MGKLRSIRGHFFIPKDVRKLAIILIINIIKKKKGTLNGSQKNSKREMKSGSENNKGLTVEKLRMIKGYESVSDEQANKIVLSIKKLAVLICEHLSKLKKRNEIDELNNSGSAKIISLNTENNNSEIEYRKQA